MTDDDAVSITRINVPSVLITKPGMPFEVIPSRLLGGEPAPADTAEDPHEPALCVVAMGVAALSGAVVTAILALLVWNLYLR